MSRAVRAALATALALAGALYAGPARAADPSTCAGYAGPSRAFLDRQEWWRDPGEAWPGHHVHIGLCVPVNNAIVDGPTDYDPIVQAHGQPPGAFISRIRLTDISPSGSSKDIWIAPKPYPVLDANGNASVQLHVTLDLSKLTTGRHEFRWGAYITQPHGANGVRPCGGSGQPACLVALVSARDEECIRACSPSYRDLTRFPVLQGAGGWYGNDTIGYSDARITSPIPTGVVSSWALKGECMDPSGAPTKKTTVAFDMRAHSDDPGTTLYSYPGATKFALTVPVPPGRHTVAVLCDAPSPISSIPGQNSGVVVATVNGG